jgi:hypothetical protein
LTLIFGGIGALGTGLAGVAAWLAYQASRTASRTEAAVNQFIAQRAEIQQNPAINVQVPVTLTLGEGRATPAPVDIIPAGLPQELPAPQPAPAPENAKKPAKPAGQE